MTALVESPQTSETANVSEVKGRHSVWSTVTGNAMLVGAIIVTAGLALIPLIYLLIGTFIDSDGFTLHHLVTAYQAGGLLELFWNSFVFAVGSAIVATVLGTALAYLVARTDVPLRGLVYATAVIPLIIPGILYTIAWILLGSGENGWLNTLSRDLLGFPVMDVYSMPGMILVEGVHSAPIVLLLMIAAFRNLDSSLEESALISGLRPFAVLRRITMPMVRPALTLSLVIILIRVLSAFEIPALLGPTAGIWVLTSQIYLQLTNFPADYGGAGAYSLSLLGVLGIIAIVQLRLARRSRSYQTITGKGFRPKVVHLGRWRWPVAGAVVVYFLLTCVFPALILLYSSTQTFYTPPTLERLKQTTLANYVEVLEQPVTIKAFVNSMQLALGSATVLMMLAAVCAWLIVRRGSRATAVLNGLALAPIGIPGLVIGVSLLFTFLRLPIPIYGTIWALLIAYVTIFLPYGMTYASSAMYQISKELEESAQVSGATFGYTFRRVVMPLLMPGLVAGWTFVVVVSIRELGASLLLYSPDTIVLPTLIWQQWTDGEFVQLATIGCLMIGALVVLVLISRRFGARVGVRSI